MSRALLAELNFFGRDVFSSFRLHCFFSLQVVPPEQVQTEAAENTGAASGCHDLPMGDRFIQLGKFRLADIDGNHFSISHQDLGHVKSRKSLFAHVRVLLPLRGLCMHLHWSVHNMKPGAI